MIFDFIFLLNYDKEVYRMFPSPYRETLITSLSSILKPTISIKSSTLLLMAFATFKAIKKHLKKN